MPQTADCVVVGGGVIGLSIAWRLSQIGIHTRIVERKSCGAEASWAGSGILSPQRPDHTSPLADLIDDSLVRYPEFCASLRELTRIDPEYERCGELHLIFSEDELQSAQADVASARTHLSEAAEGHWILHGPDQVPARADGLSQDLLGALECTVTAQVRNPRLLRGLRAACAQSGVEVDEGWEMIAVNVKGDRVIGVESASGRISCARVILCAGAWSSRAVSELLPGLPIAPVRGQIVLLHAGNRPFGPVISRGDRYLVPRRDGRVLVGSTEEPEAGFKKRNTPAGVASLLNTALNMAPCLKDAQVEAMWSGLRPGTRDGLPFIGTSPSCSGLMVAAGHFRHGLTLAPATAEAVSTLVRGERFRVDLSPFRLDRP